MLQTFQKFVDSRGLIPDHTRTCSFFSARYVSAIILTRLVPDSLKKSLRPNHPDREVCNNSYNEEICNIRDMNTYTNKPYTIQGVLKIIVLHFLPCAYELSNLTFRATPSGQNLEF